VMRAANADLSDIALATSERGTRSGLPVTGNFVLTFENAIRTVAH
jgi:hypothetical protein